MICGPTGVGKTSFAVALARRFSAEIVGADSMQIFREMNIGTAKPSADEQAAVPHHMVDVADPREGFDAVAYAFQARQAITRIDTAGKLTLVVGGTGLYIKALLHGLTQGAPSSPDVRARLQRDMAQSGSGAMHQRLSAVDPESADRIHPNDSYRIIRALEVLEITGHTISELHKDHRFSQAAYDTLQLGLKLPRDQLYARIDQRVDMMLAAGLEDEVRRLLKQGYAPSLKSMQALGYRHMVDYIQGRMTWDEAIRTLKRDHRRYAKRQLTWFNAVVGIQWLAPHQIDQAADEIHHFLQTLAKPVNDPI